MITPSAQLGYVAVVEPQRAEQVAAACTAALSLGWLNGPARDTLLDLRDEMRLMAEMAAAENVPADGEPASEPAAGT